MQTTMGDHATYTVHRAADPAARDRAPKLSHRALYILGGTMAVVSALFLVSFLATMFAGQGIRVELALIWITLFAVPAVLSGVVVHLAARRRDGAEAQLAESTHGAWEESRLAELGDAIAGLAEGLRDLKKQLQAAREDRKAIQEQQARIVSRADRLEMWLEHMRPHVEHVSARVPELMEQVKDLTRAAKESGALLEQVRDEVAEMRGRQERAEAALAAMPEKLVAMIKEVVAEAVKEARAEGYVDGVKSRLNGAAHLQVVKGTEP